jgi:hypothetical protein
LELIVEKAQKEMDEQVIETTSYGIHEKQEPKLNGKRFA